MGSRAAQVPTVAVILPAAGSGGSVCTIPRPHLGTSLEPFLSLEAALPPAPWVPWVACILPYSVPASPGCKGKGTLPRGLPIRLEACTAGRQQGSLLQLLPPLPTPSGCAQHKGQPGRGLLQGQGEAGALGPGGQIPWAFRKSKGDGRAGVTLLGRLLFRHSHGPADQGPHRRGKDGHDCTVAGSGWGSKLDSPVKPGRMEEQEWGERVFGF